MHGAMRTGHPFGQVDTEIRYGAMHGTRGMVVAMDYDSTRLAQLGRRHQRLRADLEALRPGLADEIRLAAAAGVPQAEIAAMSGYTRDQVRQITLPPERRRTRAKASQEQR